jgi:hydroxylamine reductase
LKKLKNNVIVKGKMMFCYQCEQTAQGTGCTKMGVCGKEPETADLQDLLFYAAKGISMYAHRARELKASNPEIDRFVIEALFSTVTNVNFDAERLEVLINKSGEILGQARSMYLEACKEAGNEPETLEGPANFKPAGDREGLLAQAVDIGIEKRLESLGADVTGVQELVTYGLKGTAAYADHAMILGQEDESVFAFFHEALDFLTSEKASDLNELVAMSLKVGEINLRVMELLDSANTETYGHPEPTAVRITPVKGKAILVSGHDLKDLEELLKQTEGKDINIYTHGEMLPANAYPELKKYSHLVGNYGGAWQDQRSEFDAFPGGILMTTNCIQRPKPDYKGRIFTCGLVAWPGVTHIADRDFTPVIDAALEADGFTEDAEEKTITIGFARNAVMSVAGKVIEAVKEGKIKHFFLIGGCDGAKPGRNYYTELANAVPDDCVILTLACGKYRFNKLDFGDIDGIPRLLDIGQCNDAYSAIKIAVALAEAFGCGVNDLPLSLILSWYEQKAVCILLTLLHLGIQNIKLGPSLPAFVSPDVLNVLVEKFNIAPVTGVQEDLAGILKTEQTKV